MISYKFGLLTRSGAIASFAVGMLIGILGSVEWLLLLIVFAVLGFIVTKFRFKLKKEKGIQEGKRGERTYRNVLANGMVPAFVAIISFALGANGSTLANIAYISSISVAASDTVASELGVLSDHTFLITTMERVAPGTNGGVSAYGTFWCCIGAIIASFIGWAVVYPNDVLDIIIILPVIAGIVGCMIDSVIGATLETRGIVGKLGTNAMSMALGTALAMLAYLII